MTLADLRGVVAHASVVPAAERAARLLRDALARLGDDDHGRRARAARDLVWL